MNDCLVFDATVGYNARLEETRLSTVKTPSPVLWLNLTRHCVPITRVTYTHSYGGARTHAPLVGHGWKESNELHVTEADRRVENKGGRNKHRLFAIWTRCVACQHNTIILWFFFVVAYLHSALNLSRPLHHYHELVINYYLFMMCRAGIGDGFILIPHTVLGLSSHHLLQPWIFFACF